MPEFCLVWVNADQTMEKNVDWKSRTFKSWIHLPDCYRIQLNSKYEFSMNICISYIWHNQFTEITMFSCTLLYILYTYEHSRPFLLNVLKNKICIQLFVYTIQLQNHTYLYPILYHILYRNWIYKTQSDNKVELKSALNSYTVLLFKFSYTVLLHKENLLFVVMNN